MAAAQCPICEKTVDDISLLVHIFKTHTRVIKLPDVECRGCGELINVLRLPEHFTPLTEEERRRHFLVEQLASS